MTIDVPAIALSLLIVIYVIGSIVMTAIVIRLAHKQKTWSQVRRHKGEVFCFIFFWPFLMIWDLIEEARKKWRE